MNLTNYITEIIGGAGMIVAYFAGIRKDKASLFETMQKSYKTFIDDFNIKYELMSSQVKVMQKQIETFQSNEESLRRLIQVLETKISKLENENRNLKQRINKYENK